MQMAIAGAALSVVSAAASIAGGVAADRAAKAEAKFRKKLGAAEAEDKRRLTRRLIASQEVAFAKAGIDTESGSPMDVLADTVAEEELQALRLKLSRDSQAESIRFQGKLALDAGIASGVGTVLGAAGNFQTKSGSFSLGGR